MHPGHLPQACSITLLTSIDRRFRFACNRRTELNTQKDFVKFLIGLVQGGYLVPGDFLILDNATVHVGKALFPYIVAYLRRHRIQLVRLPTYSPELNPCELVFARIKQHMRAEGPSVWDADTNYLRYQTFDAMLDAALSSISDDELENIYAHCRDPETI